MTGKASRDKGIRFERAVAKYLGTVTTRSTRPGIHDDGGDVVVRGYLVECKDHARMSIGTWWRELWVKCDEEDEPVLIVKARQQTIGESLCYFRQDCGCCHPPIISDSPITLAEWKAELEEDDE